MPHWNLIFVVRGLSPGHMSPPAIESVVASSHSSLKFVGLIFTVRRSVAPGWEGSWKNYFGVLGEDSDNFDQNKLIYKMSLQVDGRGRGPRPRATDVDMLV